MMASQTRSQPEGTLNPDLATQLTAIASRIGAIVYQMKKDIAEIRMAWMDENNTKEEPQAPLADRVKDEEAEDVLAESKHGTTVITAAKTTNSTIATTTKATTFHHPFSSVDYYGYNTRNTVFDDDVNGSQQVSEERIPELEEETEQFNHRQKKGQNRGSNVHEEKILVVDVADDVLVRSETKMWMHQCEKESKDHHREIMYVDVNEKDGLPLHEKGHMDVSSSSKATHLGKQKTMDNWKEFHVRNKDVQADLECRDLVGQFPSSRLEVKSFVWAGCIDTNPGPVPFQIRNPLFDPSPVSYNIVGHKIRSSGHNRSLSYFLS